MFAISYRNTHHKLSSKLVSTSINNGIVNIYSRGFASAAWKMLHGLYDFETSMKTELPGLPKIEDAPVAESGEVKVSRLENGVQVVSSDDGSLFSALGLFWDAGSRYESFQNAGTSHVLEMLAYKGSTKRTKLAMLRATEALASTFGAVSSREVLTYSSEGFRYKAPAMFDLMCEAATTPSMMNYVRGPAYEEPLVAELKRLQPVVKRMEKERQSDPNNVVLENLHAAAFEGNTLGYPQWATEQGFKKLTPAGISDFVRSYQYGNRVTVSGVNVDHSELVALAADKLGHLPSSSASSTSLSTGPARWTGGERRVSADGLATVAIGFPGSTWSGKDLIPICVLNSLLGGGGSFSAGGPGKGMYTKLYTRVLNRNEWVQNITSVNLVFSDAGLFGIQASASPDRLPNLVDLVANECKAIPQNLDSESVSRAKNMTLSSLLMNLETRAVKCEDMGRQVLASGKYASVEELSEKIKAVTADDLARISETMLQSPPAVSISGDLYGAPSYSQIESFLSTK
mmetsp:Transcript_3333/g.5838  ORF Transcript_3333/g.5838 Transcript_3333/m.5838 type:complete len:515 (-) Transcript_3333:36-1580(-)